MYDYGARFYDAAGVRFLTIDPRAELYYSWSPYNYVGGNPIRRIDINGEHWWDSFMGGLIGTVDNVVGSNIRGSYDPIDPDDYNSALDKADKVCLIAGAAQTAAGGLAATGGAIAAPFSEGATLVIAAAAHGTYMMSNAAKNQAKGNNYGKEKKSSNTKNEKKINQKRKESWSQKEQTARQEMSDA